MGAFDTAPVTATCHTSGCTNEGIALEVIAVVTGPDGNPITPNIQCGVCGQPITDAVQA